MPAARSSSWRRGSVFGGDDVAAPRGATAPALLHAAAARSWGRAQVTRQHTSARTSRRTRTALNRLSTRLRGRDACRCASAEGGTKAGAAHRRWSASEGVRGGRGAPCWLRETSSMVRFDRWRSSPGGSAGGAAVGATDSACWKRSHSRTSALVLLVVVPQPSGDAGTTLLRDARGAAADRIARTRPICRCGETMAAQEVAVVGRSAEEARPTWAARQRKLNKSRRRARSTGTPGDGHSRAQIRPRCRVPCVLM